jgi:prefoldin subunit 5
MANFYYGASEYVPDRSENLNRRLKNSNSLFDVLTQTHHEVQKQNREYEEWRRKKTDEFMEAFFK